MALTKVELSVIDLWTSRDLLFVVKGKGITTIHKYTKCRKPRYDTKIRRYLDRMEDSRDDLPSAKAVCVDLAGQLRYVWRTDVLTESEYDVERKKGVSGLSRAFAAKRKGAVDEG